MNELAHSINEILEFESILSKMYVSKSGDKGIYYEVRFMNNVTVIRAISKPQQIKGLLVMQGFPLKMNTKIVHFNLQIEELEKKSKVIHYMNMLVSLKIRKVELILR